MGNLFRSLWALSVGFVCGGLFISGKVVGFAPESVDLFDQR